MVKVNLNILQWARETAGLSLEEASRKLSLQEARGISPVERLQALETGDVEPSRPMLLKMAKQYRRPLIAFYLERPPRKADRGKDFRTLPDSYTDVTTGLVDALIRDIHVRQSLLRAAIEEEEDVEYLTFIGSMNLSKGVNTLVDFIKTTFEIDTNEFQNLPNPNKAFNYLREKVENAGVFVILLGNLGSHHTDFDLDVFRGFALADDLAPFIVINEKDSKSAWSFTLIHELTHILLGQTGISNTNAENNIEQFCNIVASELLLPEEDLESFDISRAVSFDEQIITISNFAISKNISSTMVAYKLYLLNKIDRQTWIKLESTYKKLWLDARNKTKVTRRGKKEKIPYYKIRRHRLGENYISSVHQLVLEGSLTTIKAGKVLGIPPKNIHKLFNPSIQMSQYKP